MARLPLPAVVLTIGLLTLAAWARGVKYPVAPGWTVESVTRGDLNGDGRPDVVLELLQKGRDKARTRRRMLTILVRGVPAVSTTRLLLSEGQGGMLGTPRGNNIILSIKHHRLVVEQLSGSRTAVDLTDTFGWHHGPVLLTRRRQIYDRRDGSGEEVVWDFAHHVKRVSETVPGGLAGPGKTEPLEGPPPSFESLTPFKP